MCDTFVCPPSMTANGHWIFGKNSDREPDEIQNIVRFPATVRSNDQQPCTFIKVTHPRDVYEVILSKPFQMWGAEMGINEKGVTIGNEAVFTKIKIDKKNSGLTGMDMIRLALEKSPTAADALSNIIALNEQYGQDACGGYRDKNMFYHNSFIIADPVEAYVLETAGPFWAVEKVSAYRAISNGLSIGEQLDDIHPKAIEFAQKKGWLKKGTSFHFANAFSSYWMPRLARCIQRRALNESHTKPGFTVNNAFFALRSHDIEPFEPAKGTTASVCMHASGLFTPHNTTGSMVAELRAHQPSTVWLTGSSAPCLSIFKPFYFGDTLLSQDIFSDPHQHWLDWESWHRTAILDYTRAHHSIQQKRETLELDWVRKDHEAKEEQQLFALSRNVLHSSLDVLNELRKIPFEKNAPWLYRKFWERQHLNA